MTFEIWLDVDLLSLKSFLECYFWQGGQNNLVMLDIKNNIVGKLFKQG